MKDITRMPLPTLYDLLSSKTLDLVEAMNGKNDSLTIMLLKLEVQTIQSEIINRKSSHPVKNNSFKFSKN